MEATHYASSPIRNPHYLLSLHSYLSDNLPELPKDFVMKNIAMTTIFLIYFYCYNSWHLSSDIIQIWTQSATK